MFVFGDTQNDNKDKPVRPIVRDKILTLGNDAFQLKVDGRLIFKCETF